MLEHREYKSFIQIRRQAFGKNFTTSTMTDTHKTTQWQLCTIWWQRKPIDTQKTYSINIYLLGIREWKNEIYHKANSAKDEKRTEKYESVERIRSFSLVKVLYIWSYCGGLMTVFVLLRFFLFMFKDFILNIYNWKIKALVY